MTTLQLVISGIGLFFAACLTIIGSLLIYSLNKLREDLKEMRTDIKKLDDKKVDKETSRAEYNTVMVLLENIQQGVKSLNTKFDTKVDPLSEKVSRIDTTTQLNNKDIDYLTKQVDKFDS